MNQPKINLVERILMAILAVLADGFEFLGVFGSTIPAIGEIVLGLSWIGGVVISAILLLWLIIKGVGIKWFLGGSGIDLIPFLNAFPGKTAGLIATFVEDSLGQKVNQETKTEVKQSAK